MNKPMKRVVGTENIFRDLGFDDAEAENLKLRSKSSIIQRPARKLSDVYIRVSDDESNHMLLL